MFGRTLKTGLLIAVVTGLFLTPALGQKITIVKARPIGEVLKALHSEDEYEGDEAMYEMVKMGKAAVPALVKLLGDAKELQANPPDGYTFHYGKGARGPIGWRGVGGGKQFYPVGLTINRLAMRALGLIGDKRAVNALVAAEKKAANNWIRNEARRALVAILGSKMPILPNMRPWQLAEIGTPEAAKALVGPIKLKYIDASNKSMKHVVAKCGPYVTLDEGAGGLNRAGENTRRIDALSAFPMKLAPDPVLRMARDGIHNDFRWFHMGMHDNPDHWHALDHGWDGHLSGQWAAVRAVGYIGDKRTIPLLRERLKDYNIMTRANAARSLAQLGDKAALKGLIDNLRWVHVVFVEEYNKKGKPWLQHWLNDNQNAVPASGKTWFRDVPSHHALACYDGLGYLKDPRAKAFLKKRAADILTLPSIDRYYQVDLLWIAASLKKHGEKRASQMALAQGMKLFEGKKATDYKLRFFHVAALPALAKMDDKKTLPTVVKVMLHHPTTWRPGQYDMRDVAWGVYLTLKGRRSPEKRLTTSEVLWLH
ncbi:MAG: HEAT repeat domain-containing protein [Planctomycetia bacterium]|nr:HEAT repeat domain-containing protein [Planctomycetia bacterium]